MSYLPIRTEDEPIRDLVETLREEFRDEDYRYAYDEEFANARIATQIKVIREAREMRQKDLAEEAKMRQSRISELENVNYSMWSISTLRRLARALGVRLSFRFESWGELLPQVEDFGRSSLERPKFENDPAFASEKIAAKPAVVPDWADKLNSKQVERVGFPKRLEGEADSKSNPQQQTTQSNRLPTLHLEKSA